MNLRRTLPAMISTVALAVASSLAQAQVDVPALMDKVGAHDARTGAEYNPTGAPIGGGEGFNNPYKGMTEGVITVASATYDALATALTQAGNSSTSKIVYVPSNFSIDMTGKEALKIPAGVTLASGRGGSGDLGALLYITSHQSTNHYAPVLITDGDNVKISGLRIRGADGTRLSNAVNLNTGVAVIHKNAEIFNNEIYNFNHAGIYAATAADLYKSETDAKYADIKNSGVSGDNLHLHHNFIHNNYGNGNGYGITVSSVEALIEANYFNYSRHAIAGTGSAGSAYEARYNIFGKRFEYYPVDMHGGADRNDGTNDAGDWVVVHHNTFYWTEHYETNPVRSVGGVHLSGQPRQGAWVFNNWYDTRTKWFEEDMLTHHVPMDPRVVDDALFNEVEPPRMTTFRINVDSGNKSCGDNCFIADAQKLLDNDIYQFNNRTKRAEWGTIVPVAGENTLIGDFDGDGELDLLDIDANGHFKVSRRIKGAGYGNPISWYTNTAGDVLDPSTFKVADFNGDGRADVMSYAGDKLQVWLAKHPFSFEKSAAAPSYASTTETSHIRIGDFDGQHGADVITFDKNNDFTVYLSGANGELASGSKWGANGAYLADGNRYRVADVNGDGRTDIVSFEDKYYVVWESLNTNQFSASGQWGSNGLALSPKIYQVGYANGDDRADIMSFENNGGKYHWTSEPNKTMKWYGEWFYSWYWYKFDAAQTNPPWWHL